MISQRSFVRRVSQLVDPKGENCSPVLISTILTEHGDQCVQHDLGLHQISGSAFDENVFRVQCDLGVITCKKYNTWVKPNLIPQQHFCAK